MRVEMERNEYLAFRRRFEPPNVTLVIVAESPPASGKYFYNPGGKTSEPLFTALMKQLGVETKKQPGIEAKKADGLEKLRERGWVLIDATYDQIDGRSENERKRVILRDYGILCDDLTQLLGVRWRDVPLILIKKNVCEILSPMLKETGFNVLNKGCTIPFPSTGNQRRFCEKFREILSQKVG
jgi:hypothetical protein